MKKNSIKALDFDKKFDKNEKILSHLDISNSRRPGLEAKSIKIDFPLWMLESLDKEAKKLGVTRQAVIKLWLSDRLQNSAGSHDN
jgi:hypothetical protein